jgi:hypothetical protein
MDERTGWNPSPQVPGSEYDLVYLPFGVLDVDPPDGTRHIPPDRPMPGAEQTVSETMEIVRVLRSGRFVLSHIEEPDGISVDLAEDLSAYYTDRTGRKVVIAYDTMLPDIQVSGPWHYPLISRVRLKPNIAATTGDQILSTLLLEAAFMNIPIPK